MAVDVLGLNDTYVSQLRDAISEGAAGLSDVPMLLKCVLREGRWRERTIKTGGTVRFERFEEFVATKPLEGLGADMGLIKRICSADPEAVDLLDRALQRESSKHVGALDNIQGTREPAPTGTSAARAVRRLREDRPDLHAKVIAGEVSPHAAMLEAGFRKPTITLPLDPDAALRLIVKHFPREGVETLLRGLANWCQKDVVDKAE
jgi:hypothetical protein